MYLAERYRAVGLEKEIMSNGRVQGKVAIVTGGARGIGAEICRVLEAEGATVVPVDMAPGENVRTLNVTDETQVKAVFDAVAEEFGRIDILVNNAGIIGPIKPAHEIEEKEFTTLFDVDVKGVWLCTKHAVRHMLETGGGSIVNLSSINGLVGGSRIPLYHAAKGAVRLMSKADAATYARQGIRVNSIHPGVIETELARSVSSGGSPEAAAHAQRQLDATPMGHRGTPTDIAYGVLYLASDEAAFVTGAELAVDGGFSAV